MKRSLSLLIIILVIALVIGAGYLLRRDRGGDIEFPTNSNTPTPGESNTDYGQLPLDNPEGEQPQNQPSTETPPLAHPTLSNEQKISLIANTEVLDYVVDAAKNIILIRPDGQVMKISPEGVATVLNATYVPELHDASFSSSGAKLFASRGDARSPTITIFDVKTLSWRSFFADAHSPTWSPNSEELAYFTGAQSKKNLEIVDVSTSTLSPRFILSIHAEDTLLQWPNKETLYLTPRSSAHINGSLWQLDLKTKRLSLVLKEQPGLNTLFSSVSEHGLIFTGGTNRKGGQLQVLNTDTEGRRVFQGLTLPSKCVFYASTPSLQLASSSGTILYCALPRNTRSFELARLPDDYEKRSLFSLDDFYRISLDTNTVSALFTDNKQKIDATRIKIFNKYIYFINRYDKKLYAAPLQ